MILWPLVSLLDLLWIRIWCILFIASMVSTTTSLITPPPTSSHISIDDLDMIREWALNAGAIDYEAIKIVKMCVPTFLPRLRRVIVGISLTTFDTFGIVRLLRSLGGQHTKKKELQMVSPMLSGKLLESPFSPETKSPHPTLSYTEVLELCIPYIEKE